MDPRDYLKWQRRSAVFSSLLGLGLGLAILVTGRNVAVGAVLTALGVAGALVLLFTRRPSNPG
jgi:hypothetical protein